jgi:hypothetical protein
MVLILDTLSIFIEGVQYLGFKPDPVIAVLARRAQYKHESVERGVQAVTDIGFVSHSIPA